MTSRHKSAGLLSVFFIYLPLIQGLIERRKIIKTQLQENPVENTDQDSQVPADKESLSQKKQVDAP